MNSPPFTCWNIYSSSWKLEKWTQIQVHTKLGLVFPGFSDISPSDHLVASHVTEGHSPITFLWECLGESFPQRLDWRTSCWQPWHPCWRPRWSLRWEHLEGRPPQIVPSAVTRIHALWACEGWQTWACQKLGTTRKKLPLTSLQTFWYPGILCCWWTPGVPKL